MTLLACGINHLTAPVDLREQVALSPLQAKNALQELISIGAVNEAVILSTCNRVEIYSEVTDFNKVQQWISHNLALPVDPYWYFHTERNAVSHIMRVASGLDSMVMGEPQILGQMKDAVNLAQEVGALGSGLQRLFQRVFNVTKQVRTDTKIGANPITLGFAAVTLAKRIFSDLSKRNVLLIGAGDIIELAALHLFNQGIKRFIIASRSLSKAEKLATRVHGHWIPMGDIPLYLTDSDIVISATGSELPLLGKGAVERAIKARKHRPIFMVDLAVPRDIEPEVGSLEDIYLYNIDDLKTIIDESKQCREDAALHAEGIIELQAEHYIRNIQSLNASSLIRQFRAELNTIAQQEVQRASVRLEQGVDPKIVIEHVCHNLLNKFSHAPCAKMKQAGYDGRLELLAFARQLLDIKD
ncbi:MAG: glutamyl-tRNA reductase [Gammaproteobacteria bacterium]|nr:glutamyl-tRNA reductase [Gammaproteobacteria bacterium]